MLTELRPAILVTLLLTLLVGVGYPLAVTGIAQVVFPQQAGGSLVRSASGQVIGSRLLAQAFTGPAYLHPRPSAAGSDGYDAAGSSGSNMGPLNEALGTRVREAAAALRTEARTAPIPADAVTTSGSGLDPDISPENALRQVARIAAARGQSPASVRRIVRAHIAGPALGFLGQPTVNVLETNLALDAAFPRAQRPAQ